MLGSLVDLGPKREPIPIVGNLTRRSYHGNCLLWKNGLKWFNLKSFNLPEGRLLRERERGSLLVHALSHPYFLTSLFILFVFLCFPFSFPFPYSLYFSLFFVVLSCYFSHLFLFIACLSPPLLCTAKPFFILLAMISFIFLPLNYFWPGMGVLLGPPTGLLAAQPAPLPCAGWWWLRHVPFPNKRVLFLFSCSLWHSHLDKCWVFSLTNSYGMHLVIPA